MRETGEQNSETPGGEETQVRDQGRVGVGGTLFRTTEDLRAQIFANSVDNAHIVL